jgi:membrane protein
VADGIAGLVERVRDWADALQRRHHVLGFPFAVVKKYGDDDGIRHAALLTYYGFLSIFPLLLLVTVVVTALLQGNPDLRAELIDAIVPKELQTTVTNALAALPTSGVPLVIGVVGLVLSGLGIVFSGYHTLNHVAAVPHRLRHEFFPRYVRIVVMLLLLVVGVAGVGVLTVAAGALPDVAGGSRIAAFAGNVAIVFLLLWVATELLLPHRARLRIVWPAALIGALMIAGVLTFGAVVVPPLIARSGPVYGSFATIVAFFTIIFLTSQVLVFAGEVAIVRRRRLWPRSLDTTKPTDADQRALSALARVQERIPVERVQARFDAPVERGPRR